MKDSCRCSKADLTFAKHWSTVKGWNFFEDFLDFVDVVIVNISRKGVGGEQSVVPCLTLMAGVR